MLAIAGGKGGCGKTTTALGIAGAMAETGRRPIVVDTDLAMPDLHHRAGVDRTPGVGAVDETPDLPGLAQPSSRVPGVQVLPCAGASSTALASALEALAGLDRPVVLDCPAGAGPDSVLPLQVATRTVLVATPDRQSLQDAAKTAAMARQLDAAPVLTTLVRSGGAVDPEPLLEVPTTVHVPEVSLPPLEAEAAKNRYRAVVRGLIERNV